jgi:heptosyltransferase-1
MPKLRGARRHFPSVCDLNVLIVKTSSLGDVIHTLPAITDAVAALPGIRFDWVVEEAFAEVPGWHPAVEQVIPVALRRWRRGWRQAWRSGELGAFRRKLAARRYDLVLDAQGLIKSAALALLANGRRAGLDRGSAREPLAAFCYHRRIGVAREMHAVERVRRLFAAALGYAMPDTAPDYGIQPPARQPADPPYLLFLHGTTWPTKQWPQAYWIELARLAAAAGYEIRLPWGNPGERTRAEEIAAVAGAGRLLPASGLSELAAQLAGAAGVVGVDSGLAHLAAALAVPAVTLYGPTRTELTGAVGPRQINLKAEFPCAPCMRRACDYSGEREVEPACFASLPPVRVWQQLQIQMQGEGA